MDDRRFDALTVSVSAAVSRRQVIKALSGGLLAALVGSPPWTAAQTDPADSPAASRSPNFPFLAASATDPGLQDFALDFRSVAQPTWYRTASAFGLLSPRLRTLLGRGFRGGYAATIARAKADAPVQVGRSITTLLIDLGSGAEATRAHSSYADQLLSDAQDAGASVTDFPSAPQIGEATRFIGCDGGCEDVASLPGRESPDHSLTIVTRRDRFLLDLRIRDFNNEPIAPQDGEAIARMVDAKLGAVVVPSAATTEPATAPLAAKRLLTGAARVAARFRRAQDAQGQADLEQRLARTSTFAAFGVDGETLPTIIRQWLSVDGGFLVLYFAETADDVNARKQEVPDTVYAEQATQPVPLASAYRGNYDLTLTSTQYFLATPEALQAFQASARQRREGVQPGITLTDADAAATRRSFTFELSHPSGRTLSGYETHALVGGALNAALLVTITALPRDPRQPAVPADALRQELGPLVSRVVEVLTNCVTSPDTCPETESLPSPAQVAQCPAGTQRCGGACVATTTDPANCGACGQRCAQGQICVSGGCVCAAGLTSCGGVCVATSTDEFNCGQCGRRCAAGEACVSGTCQVTCAPMTDCNGVCVDTSTDEANCGRCGTACGQGATCVGGACVCSAGLNYCGGRCVDTDVDLANCGACGAVCESGLVGVDCFGGECRRTSCPAALTSCGDANRPYEEHCFDLSSDPNHCGACGQACASSERCQEGTCVVDCGSLTNCGGVCVDTTSDPANCGGCGIVCSPDQTCVSGGCVCAAGLTNCGGVCVDTSSDPFNCGGCGITCSADETCESGTCTDPCAPLDNCGGVCVDLSSDPFNCGGCGIVCSAGQICDLGGCTGGCEPLTDCGGVCVDTTSDPANCGGCGIACASDESCSGGSCFSDVG